MPAIPLLFIVTSVFGEAPQHTGTVPELFPEPDLSAKQMVRMRFPHAGAGKDENASIEKQIFELPDKRFGGVETAMLMSLCEKNENDEARGWDYGKI